MAGPRNATSGKSGRTYLWPPTRETFESVTTAMGKGVPKNLTDWAAMMAALYGYNNLAIIEALQSTGGPYEGDYHDWKAQWWGMSDYDRKEVGDWASFILKGGDLSQVPPALTRFVALHLMRNAHLRDRDAAGNQGTKTHDWAERISLELASLEDVPPVLQGHVGQFVKFLEEWQPEYEASEMTVYSRKHQYAGTLDAIATLPGLGKCLIDYKTNRSGIFGDVALQLAAYRHADFIGLPDDTEQPMFEVDNCVGLWITADKYQVIPMRADDEVFEYFVHARHVANWAENVSKTVLSRPLLLPPKTA